MLRSNTRQECPTSVTCYAGLHACKTRKCKLCFKPRSKIRARNCSMFYFFQSVIALALALALAWKLGMVCEIVDKRSIVLRPVADAE